MSGITDRIAEICEGYFKYLESDGYYPAGCNGDELAKRLVAELGLTRQELTTFSGCTQFWYATAPERAE